MKPLADEEKMELLKCIRFSYLQHKELVSLFDRPVFAPAKKLVICINKKLQIMEGLSMRLNKYEKGVEEENKTIIL